MTTPKKWPVLGHWRHLRDGRKVWVDPHMKGERDESDCNCGITNNPDYPEIRERHRENTHSPYCPVGKRDRGGS